MDWTKTDIRDYDVIQPNGPKSVLGKVKFSFPSQHTVFMHDTAPGTNGCSTRAATPKPRLHAGCDPVGLARIAPKEDKGWTAAKIDRPP